MVDMYPVAHGFPTDLSQNNACSKEEMPFINHCNYDAVGKLLLYLYENELPNKRLKPQRRDWHNWGNLILFDQQEFADSTIKYEQYGLDKSGLVFIPQSCSDKETTCKVHVALHGCWQSK